MLNYNDISPRYITELKIKLKDEIWEKFPSYKQVRLFILSSVVRGEWNEPDNFTVYYQDEKRTKVDIEETIVHMPPEEVIKMSIDLGIDTPGFIPSIPRFKNVLKDENQTAYQNFQRAIKNVYDNPDEAVHLASSTLEGIIRTILADKNFKNINNNLSLTRLINKIVEQLELICQDECPTEIRTIAGQLRGLGKAIDDLRSDKTTAHGKHQDDYTVDNPLWAELAVNTSATLGLFLWEYYDNKFREKEDNFGSNSIDLSEIPF